MLGYPQIGSGSGHGMIFLKLPGYKMKNGMFVYGISLSGEGLFNGSQVQVKTSDYLLLFLPGDFSVHN